MEIPLQFRRGTAAEWTASDPVLLEGEIGLVLVEQDNDPDTQPLFKIGNGASKWSELEWAQRGPRGWGFQFQWNGYELGVKREDQDTYQFTDLRGARGANIQYQWTGTTLAVKTSDDESFPAGVGLGLQFQWNGYELGVKRDEDAEFQAVNLRGANFQYEWDGTSLGVKTSDEAEFSHVGLGLQYVWDGYSLGVKRQEDAEHVFQNLRGASLQFQWNGYELGVKDSDQESYEFTDLRGARGANFQYQWTGTVLAVKSSDDAEFPAGVDLKGETGSAPAHTWSGTSLTFKNPDGSDGNTVDLKGETGDPGELTEGKIWVGNSEGIAEEQDLPETDVGSIAGLNERLRQYVYMYSQLLKDETVWVPWRQVQDKPETYPPAQHGHEFSDFGSLDFQSNTIVNKPFVPGVHCHLVFSKRQENLIRRKAYMYGGLE